MLLFGKIAYRRRQPVLLQMLPGTQKLWYSPLPMIATPIDMFDAID
jgi:hypothetical protein